MGKFLESEKINQAHFKATSPTISEAARSDGIYKGKPRSFCLPREYAQENLYPPIREKAMQFWADHHIKWHDGADGKPSNHLCSSMVCGVNFLFPFADQPDALAETLRPFYPDLKRMLPVESGSYVSFEWIGAENYLSERMQKNSTRTRGANFTSADSVVLFERMDGKRHVALIEWKYTESYGSQSKLIASSGTDRSTIYRHLFDQPDCPINREILPGFADLFYEPFYQFLRQQFLAHEMEKAHELGADIVSVLHICPACNTDFRKVTSPNLRPLGNTAIEVWKKLLMQPDRFQSVSIEELFGTLTAERVPAKADWLAYVRERYWWMP